MFNESLAYPSWPRSKIATTYCFSWFFPVETRCDGVVLSVEGRTTSSRSGRVARAGGLVDVVALAKAEAKELFDLLPHLHGVVVMVAWSGVGRRDDRELVS